MADVQFPEGISIKDPHANAPDCVKGSISIKKAEIIPFLEKRSEWTNLDIKRSKGGKLYLSINDFTPSTPRAEDGKDGLPF